MEETKKKKEQAADASQKKAKNRKKLKYGSLATGITIIFVAVVVLVNVVVSQLVDRYPNLKLDLTTNNIYEISDETMDYIKNLNQKVEIGVSVEESSMDGNQNYKMIKEMLDKYKGYSDQIEVEYFDTTKDPDILNKYQEVYGAEIQAGCIVVSSDNRAKAYSLVDLFEIDESTYQQYAYYGYNVSKWSFITGFKGEQVLTTAIMNVTDSNPKNVGIIAYNNNQYLFYSMYESTVGGIMQLLDENGYNVSTINLASDQLDPEKYDILLLPAPTSDLTTDAVNQLSDFLYHDGAYGKQLIYIADYTQASSMPNLESFLKDWCVSVDSSIVIDENGSTSQQVGQSIVPVATVASDASDYAAGLANAALPIVAPSARPIDLVSTNNERNVIPILETSATSYRYPLDALLSAQSSKQNDAESELQEGLQEAETTEAADATTTTTATSFDKSTAEKASNTVMALVQNQYATGSEVLESDVLVLGSMQMLNSSLVQDAAYNNAQMFISTLNTICGKEDSIVVATKDLNITSITASASQISVIKTIVVWVIPICVAVIGIVVFIRRRNR